MTLPRATVTEGITQELDNFAALVRSLDDEQWAKPSRCSGWTVADVAAHLTGGMTDVVNGRLEGLGTPEVTERQVVERRGLSPAEIADELENDRKLTADLLGTFDDAAWAGPVPGGIARNIGNGVEALWYDAYLHADDIRAAIGQPSVATGPGLEASISHLAAILEDQKWGPATLALDGVAEYGIGEGSGKRITGDAFEFVKVATGRADPSAFGLGPDVNVYR